MVCGLYVAAALHARQFLMASAMEQWLDAEMVERQRLEGQAKGSQRRNSSESAGHIKASSSEGVTSNVNTHGGGALDSLEVELEGEEYVALHKWWLLVPRWGWVCLGLAAALSLFSPALGFW